MAVITNIERIIIICSFIPMMRNICNGSKMHSIIFRVRLLAMYLRVSLSEPDVATFCMSCYLARLLVFRLAPKHASDELSHTIHDVIFHDEFVRMDVLNRFQSIFTLNGGHRGLTHLI